MARDPRVDAYIEKQADFAQPILTWIRARFHAACPEVEESIKWSRPFFSYKGRPLGNMSGFKEHASFGFWQRSQLPTGREGEAMGQYGRLAAVSDLPPIAEVEDRVREATRLIDEGVRSARANREPKGEADVPEALAEALANDGAAAATFNGFPTGQRREYCEWVAEAKRADTRDKRIAQAIEWLREGKRRNWKYE